MTEVDGMYLGFCFESIFKKMMDLPQWREQNIRNISLWNSYKPFLQTFAFVWNLIETMSY